MPGSLTRWEPFAEFAELRNRLDRMVDELAGGQERKWTPAIDVVRADGELVVHADVPGVKPDEIEVEVQDDILTLSGRHAETTEHKEHEFVRRERRIGSFSRSMPLPPGVKPEDIKATTHDGVLEVHIPMPPEAGHKGPVKITPTAG